MTNTEAPIVVGYDGSPIADGALAWAAAAASLTDSPIHVIVVIPDAAGVEETTNGEAARSAAQRALEEHGTPETTVELLHGSIVPTLLDASQRASMLVVGSRGHGQLAGSLTGSVSQHVARHASCPVVVFRPPAAKDPGRIVVGVDGSGGSAAALEFACDRAQLTGELVVAVHGWRLTNVPVDQHGNLPVSLVARIEDEERLLAESVAGLRDKYPDLALDTMAIPVVAQRALADASFTASLVVVGSRGLGAFPGLLLGSVSADVAQHAHCPVAIVR